MSDKTNKTSEPQNNQTHTNQNKDEKKICPNCGAEIMGWYIFCDACGTKLN